MRAAGLILLAALAVAGCARKGAPQAPGGEPLLSAPVVIAPSDIGDPIREED
jgi:hypothetical protein